MRPATSAAGIPADAASRCTKNATLPDAVCESNLPSPVMTRSADATAAGSPIASAISAAPVRRRAPHASSPKAVPPAAPAPGTSGSAGTSSANRCRLRSSGAMSPAPFCGPNTAAAPWGPSSGLSTSVSTQAPRAGSARMPVKSTEEATASPRLPRGTSAPVESSTRAPSADSAPAPPSVDALPPRASNSRSAPRSSAVAMSCPKPKVCASCGSKGSSRVMPLDWASSITAVPSASSSQSARTSRPSGAHTDSVNRFAVTSARAIASMVPSPPSAIGRRITSSPGLSPDHPAAIALAAATALALPLKESGAMTMRTRPTRAGTPRRCS